MRKLRILVTGANGMLGQRIIEFYSANKNVELLGSSFEEKSVIDGIPYISLDLTDKKAVKKVVTEFYPDVIIHTAAYTNVDKCESDKEAAYSTNVNAVEYLAKYGKITQAKIIHLSTDYVFDGNSGPYTEEDRPEPIGYYGRTKLAGENALKASGVKHAVIRTNVLYGVARHGRQDFVKWVVNSLKDEKPIRIVNDQINNPTFIDDLVSAISGIIEFDKSGVYNIGGSEFLNRYQFTLRIADYFGLDKSFISEITTAELNQPAPRPLKSGLVILKAETELGYKPRTIEESLSLMRKELQL
ncbi:MAG: NAD(P)-dependent oxidoreductase [Melioribacteraceae bacterium]|nr:MAG: NAD(P)-dependent oxidoreductase [Melioribacteraceae bacterium]